MSSWLNTSEFWVNVFFTLHEKDNKSNFILITYIVYVLKLYYLLNI